MRTAWWLPVCLLLLGSAGYVAASRLTFAAPSAAAVPLQAPTSNGPMDSNDCGFSPADYTDTGTLRFTNGEAWWLSFVRKQEYFSALSMGCVLAFVGCSIGKIRQIGAGAASGMYAGGGVLALLTLCLGCLAPTLSAIGLGFAANLGLAQWLPKWFVLLNTAGLSLAGMLFLARRARACPLPEAAAKAALTATVNQDLTPMERA